MTWQGPRYPDSTCLLYCLLWKTVHQKNVLSVLYVFLRFSQSCDRCSGWCLFQMWWCAICSQWSHSPHSDTRSSLFSFIVCAVKIACTLLHPIRTNETTSLCLCQEYQCMPTFLPSYSQHTQRVALPTGPLVLLCILSKMPCLLWPLFHFSKCFLLFSSILFKHFYRLYLLFWWRRELVWEPIRFSDKVSRCHFQNTIIFSLEYLLKREDVSQLYAGQS